MKKAPKKLLLVAALVAAFGYGMAAARYHLFPYPALKGLATAVSGWFAGGADTPQGVWRPVQSAGGTDPSRPDVEVVKDLANLPYLHGYVAASVTVTVTDYDPELACNGLNLVVSGHGPEAFLQDMLGNTLHTWRCDLADAFADLGEFDGEPGAVNWWRRAYVYPNGDLLAIFDGVGMIKLDRDSRLLWAHLGGEHHDLDFDDDGNILTLTRRRTVFDDARLKLEGPIQEDFITVLSPDGQVLSELSVLRCFVDSDYYSALAAGPKAGDLLHTNTIELMDGRFADRYPMFEKGNLLISSPMTHVIAVIDPDQKKVVWADSGLWMFQHQPTVLDNGNLLVFDNLGEYGYSKVIEYDPLTQAIAWSYRHTDERRFSSAFLGSCERLANGNTLITESTAGCAFEVTPDGEVVWRFTNPERAGDDNELIASLLEVVRIEPSYFDADFTAAHNEYVTGKRVVDAAGVESLIQQLEK